MLSILWLNFIFLHTVSRFPYPTLSFPGTDSGGCSHPKFSHVTGFLFGSICLLVCFCMRTIGKKIVLIYFIWIINSIICIFLNKIYNLFCGLLFSLYILDCSQNPIWFLLRKHSPSLIIEKYQIKSSGVLPKKICSGLLRTVHFMENWESLRHCEESKGP